jgi:chemotaxis protein CheD
MTPTDVFLQPGEWFVGDARHRVRTVLGSCISMTLWDPRSRLGAMSHFMLASRGRARPGALDGRYGDEALRLMVSALERRSVRVTCCEAKVFGGGDMFPGGRGGHGGAVGRRNGEAARALLAAYGIALVSESLYGEGHRQIVFDIGTGDVWARQLPPLEKVEAMQ